MQENLKFLPAALLPWYEENKRALPWREDTEPYHVWVSEIMLQQTRVEAVRGYYTRFLATLPTIVDLANADDELLQKLWEGLGYYSRVRNLKKAARVIMEKYGGVFPNSYEDVLALPGIGPYTAGAICSICFNLPTPAVDGNVLRVIARLTDDFRPVDTGVYKKEVQKHLAEIYPSDAGKFTQALMELGATVCGPNRRPDCKNCPCCRLCQGKHHAEKLPVRLPRKSRRTEERTVFIISCDGYYALAKRPGKGLLAGMWQFPDLPGRLDEMQAVSGAGELGFSVSDILKIVKRQHIFTHITWDMHGVYLCASKPHPGYVWKTAEEIKNGIALPTAYRQFLDEEK